MNSLSIMLILAFPDFDAEGPILVERNDVARRLY
jgi:hypothetical protein